MGGRHRTCCCDDVICQPGPLNCPGPGAGGGPLCKCAPRCPNTYTIVVSNLVLRMETNTACWSVGDEYDLSGFKTLELNIDAEENLGVYCQWRTISPGGGQCDREQLHALRMQCQVRDSAKGLEIIVFFGFPTVIATTTYRSADRWSAAQCPDPGQVPFYSFNSPGGIVTLVDAGVVVLI